MNLIIYNRLLLVIAIGTLMVGCSKKADIPINMLEAKNELRNLKEVEWPAAYRDQNTGLLDKILAEEFELIDADGNRSTKEFELNWIKNNSMNYDSFRYEIKRLEIFENRTAIVAGTGHIINEGSKTTYESSNVLIWRNGLWKALSSHVSGIKVNPD